MSCDVIFEVFSLRPRGPQQNQVAIKSRLGGRCERISLVTFKKPSKNSNKSADQEYLHHIFQSPPEFENGTWKTT